MPPAVVPLQDHLQDDIHAQKTTRAAHVNGHRTGNSQNIKQQSQHLASKRVILAVSNRDSGSSSEETTQPVKVAGRSTGGDGDGALALGISRVSTSDRGRIVVADSYIPKGTLLFAASAQAIVCDSGSRKRRCGSCLRPLQALERHKNNSSSETDSTKEVLGIECEGCHEIWYCHRHRHDRSCSQSDYQGIHQFECRFLRQLYHGSDHEYNSLGAVIRLQDPHRKAVDRFRFLDDYDQDYCRVLIRTLIHRFKEYTAQGAGPHNNTLLQRAGAAKDEISMDDDETPEPLPYSAVLELVENKECVPISKLEGDMTDVAKILDAFQEHLYQQSANKTEALKAPRLTLEELLSLVLKEESNSFGLYDHPTYNNVVSETRTGSNSASPLVTKPVNNNAKQGYGLGLFVDWYLYSFNHSCSPNLYHVAHNSQLLVYTARDIQRGEELNISYLELGPHYRFPSELEGRDGAVEQQARKRALAERRAILKHHFYFACGCSRCQWETALSDEERTGESMSQDEEAFMREGILCSRKGCFGFYAPPDVLRVLGRFNDDSEHWHCVACGFKQL